MRTNPYGVEAPQVLRIKPEAFQSGLCEPNDRAVGHIAEWSVLVYVAANCNLAQKLFDNVLALKTIASSESVNVCVMFAGPYLGDSFFARFNRETTFDDDVLFRFWTFPTDSSETFAQAQVWSRVFPAKRRLMILSGHGFGWRGVLLNQHLAEPYLREKGRVVLPAPFDVCDGARRAAMGRVQDRLNERLPNGIPDGSLPYDVLAFDACYMGNLETLSSFTGYARTAVVSENTLPGDGYPYVSILEHLHADPTVAGPELATFILEESKRFYAVRPAEGPISQAALQCNEFAAFVDSFAKFIRVLNVYEDGATYAAVRRAFGHVKRYDTTVKTGFIDLIGFIRLLIRSGLSEQATALARVVLDRWATFVSASSCEASDTGSNGLSIYAPEPAEFDAAYIETSARLPFGIHLWSGFLAQYYLRLLGAEAPGHPLIEAIGRAMNTAIAAGSYSPPAAPR